MHGKKGHISHRSYDRIESIMHNIRIVKKMIFKTYFKWTSWTLLDPIPHRDARRNSKAAPKGKSARCCR